MNEHHHPVGTKVLVDRPRSDGDRLAQKHGTVVPSPGVGAGAVWTYVQIDDAQPGPPFAMIATRILKAAEPN